MKLSHFTSQVFFFCSDFRFLSANCFLACCNGRVGEKRPRDYLAPKISSLWEQRIRIHPGISQGKNSKTSIKSRVSSILTLLGYWVQRQNENDMVVKLVPGEIQTRSIYFEIKHRCFENGIILPFEKYQSNDRKKCTNIGTSHCFHRVLCMIVLQPFILFQLN